MIPCSESSFLAQKYEQLEKDLEPEVKENFFLKPVFDQLHEITAQLKLESIQNLREKIIVLEQLSEETKQKDVIEKIKVLKNVTFLLEALTTLQIEILSEKTLDGYRGAISQIDQEAILNEKTGDNLLLLCAKSSNPQLRDLVLECLKQGADPNSSNINKYTALHCACLYGDSVLVEALIKRKADHSLKNRQGNLPMDLALRSIKPQREIIKLLIQGGHELQTPLKKNIPTWIALLKPACQSKGFLAFFISLLDSIEDVNQTDDNRKTALQIAAQEKNHKIFIELILLGAKFGQTKEELSMLSTLAPSEALPVYEKLWQQGILPMGPEENGASPLAILAQAIKDYEKYGLKAEIVDLLVKFGDLVGRYKSAEDPIEKLFFAKELESITNKIKDLNFTKANQFEDFFENLTKSLFTQHRIAIKKLEELEKSPKKIGQLIKDTDWEWEPKPDEFDGVALLSLAIQENKTHLIPLIIKALVEHPLAISLTASKSFFHFLLDKAPTRQSLKEPEVLPFHGGMIYENGTVLVRAINETLEMLQEQPKEIVDSFQSFVDRMVEPLTICTKWSYKSSSPTTYREIVEQISQISPNRPILIPISIAQHSMSMLVEYTEEGKVHLTFFNTGAGLKHHPRWKGTNLYQTFLSIEGVDKAHLADPAIWEDLFKLCASTNSVDPIYDYFFKVLGQGLKVSPPSDNQEDYEQKQFQGTCSAQNLMASVRYVIMQSNRGTPSERLAVYKILKANFLKVLGGQIHSKLDDTIQDIGQKKLQKQEAVLYLAKVAADENAFKETLAKITETLSQLGEMEIAEGLQIEAPNTTFARFHLLRIGSKTIAEHWLCHPEKIDVGPQDLSLALSIFENRNFVQQNFEKLLQEMQDKKEFALLGKQLIKILNSSFKNFGERWMLEKLSDLEGIKALLENIKGQSGQQFKRNLIELFEKNGQREIVDYIKNYERT